MKLFIDLGNSRIKWAISNNRHWERHCATHDRKQLPTQCIQFWKNMSPPEQVLVSSVAGDELNTAITDWCHTQWSEEPRFIQSQSAQLGVSNGYRDPAQLGCDRWAALIAAWQIAHNPAVVIDCGTAVTVDSLDNKGRFRGGIIFPGRRLMREALNQSTSQIDTEEASDFDIFARSTRQAVEAGGQAVLVGGVTYVLQEVRQRLGSVRLFITGGGGKELIYLLELSRELLIEQKIEHKPDLVLEGLAMIANQEP